MRRLLKKGRRSLKSRLLIVVASLEAAAIVETTRIETATVVETTSVETSTVEVVVAIEAVLVLVGVVLTERLANIQLVVLEDEVLLALSQHLHGVGLVFVGDETVALRVANRVGYDTRVLDATKVGKVVAELILRGSLRNAADVDAVADGLLHALVAMVLLLELLLWLLKLLRLLVHFRTMQQRLFIKNNK